MLIIVISTLKINLNTLLIKWPLRAGNNESMSFSTGLIVD